MKIYFCVYETEQYGIIIEIVSKEEATRLALDESNKKIFPCVTSVTGGTGGTTSVSISIKNITRDGSFSTDKVNVYSTSDEDIDEDEVLAVLAESDIKIGDMIISSKYLKLT